MPRVDSKKSAANFLPKSNHSKTILQQRAALLAKMPVDLDQENQLQAYICFKLGENQLYGMPYENVIEVLDHQIVTKIPGTTKFIKGAINRRGKLIAVIDVGSVFQLSKSDGRKDYDIIVVQAHGMMVGLLVEMIIGSATYEPHSLELPMEIDTAIKQKYLIGLHKGTIGLIHIENILFDCIAELKQEQS